MHSIEAMIITSANLQCVGLCSNRISVSSNARAQNAIIVALNTFEYFINIPIN